MPTERAKSKLTSVAHAPAIDENPCPLCFGSGMEIVAGKGARVCPCQRSTGDTGFLEKAKLPRRYLTCHFNKYQPANDSQRAALKTAIGFVNDFPAVERGILFSGTVGVGKTHLAVSILMGLSERGFKCLFYEFGSLLKEIQDSYNPNTKTSELSVLAPVLNADVLVLDELGSSKPTEWVNDTLYQIINRRYNDLRPTIFTTNYLDHRQKESESLLEDRIGQRLRSRLYQMCQTVEMHGEDHRKRFDSNPFKR